MKLSDAEKGIFAAKVDLTDFYNNDEEVWIELRELTGAELTEAQSAYTKDEQNKTNGQYLLKYLEKNLSKFIVDHNFVNDKEEKASNEEVAKHLRKRGVMMSHILKEWQKKMYSQNKIISNYENTQNTTSEAQS